jgi:cold shock CspA family protein
MLGKVSWFSVQKKFGFLTAESNAKDEQSKDYFFHQNDIVTGSEVKAEDRVQFDLGERNGRVKAINVRIAE